MVKTPSERLWEVADVLVEPLRNEVAVDAVRCAVVYRGHN